MQPFKQVLIVALIGCFFMMPQTSKATTFSVDKGTAYKFSGYSSYTSGNASIMKAYPSGIFVATGTGSAKIKAGNTSHTFKVRKQTGYSVNNTSSFATSKTVTLKANSGYKVYYTTGNAYSSNKLLKSGKSKNFTFSSTGNLHVYAVKNSTKVKIASLNSALKSQKDNCFIYTKYAKPSYTIPQNAKGTYGQNVKEIKLPSGFSWQSSAVLNQVGVMTVSATFTPADTMKYATISNIPVKITVNKANPSYSIPGPFYKVLKEKIEDTSLPAQFTWESTGTFDSVGEKTYYVKYTPADIEHYNIIEHIPVKVEVAENDITKYTINPIPSYVATGKAITPKVIINGLQEGTDYTVSYEDNIGIGYAKVVVKGKGKYTGIINTGFNITYSPEGFFYELKLMGSNMKKNKFHYSNDDVKGSYEKALKTNKRYNCALYVAWTLQKMGYLKSGQTFYYSAAKKQWQGSYKSIKNATIIPVNKLTKNAWNQLKPGDICGFGINKTASHTAVYAGNKKWYSGGNGDSKDGNFGPKAHGYYAGDNDYIYSIIRITK